MCGDQVLFGLLVCALGIIDSEKGCDIEVVSISKRHEPRLCYCYHYDLSHVTRQAIYLASLVFVSLLYGTKKRHHVLDVLRSFFRTTLV